MKSLNAVLCTTPVRYLRFFSYLTGLLAFLSVLMIFLLGGRVVEADSNIATIPVGTSPTAIAINEATNKIYVLHQQSNNVWVIDGTNNSTTIVPVGTTPTAIAVNPVTNKVYVSNSGTANVTVIDGATSSTTTIATSLAPLDIGVNTSTNKIYVASASARNVAIIDGATNSTTSVATGSDPRTIAINEVTNKIYVVNGNNGTVTVIDGTTLATATITAGSFPEAMAVNSVTNKIYVANLASNNVTIIDGTNNSTTTVAVGSTPRAIAVNSATNRIYVANSNSSTVTLIEGSTNSTATIPVGSLPNAVAVNPATNKIYVANSSSNNVTVIDSTNNTTTTVAAGSFPNRVAVNSTTSKIYVVNNSSANVTVIDGAGFNPGGCTASATVDPADLTFPQAGGTRTVNVTVSSPQCIWIAYESLSVDQFVSIDNRFGTGNGSFRFTVSANGSQFGRSGTINIIINANPVPQQTFTILQLEGGCFYSLSKPEVSVDSKGDFHTVILSAPDGCTWTAQTNEPWIHLASDSLSGSGSKEILYSLEENSDSYRTGVITIGGQHHIIHQHGKECPYTFICQANPEICASSASMPASAKSGLNQIYGFRDEVLAKTPRGKKYAQDYYQYAGEITKLLIFNPRLLTRTMDGCLHYEAFPGPHAEVGNCGAHRRPN